MSKNGVSKEWVDQKVREYGSPFAHVAKETPARCELKEVPALYAAIECVINLSGAVLIGGTRDGGAYCITVMLGDKRHKAYASSRAELDEVAQAMLQTYG